jgi:hypothetical protein
MSIARAWRLAATMTPSPSTSKTQPLGEPTQSGWMWKSKRQKSGGGSVDGRLYGSDRIHGKRQGIECWWTAIGRDVQNTYQLLRQAFDGHRNAVEFMQLGTEVLTTEHDCRLSFSQDDRRRRSADAALVQRYTNTCSRREFRSAHVRPTVSPNHRTETIKQHEHTIGAGHTSAKQLQVRLRTIEKVMMLLFDVVQGTARDKLKLNRVFRTNA